MIQQQKIQDEINRISEGFTSTNSGLKYNINESTNGVTPIDGDRVSVHYSGRLINGNEFDSSYKRNKPFEFSVGQGRVIKGWDEALKILKVGEKGTFVIPSNLGYGARGAGGVIPPNATLIFEIELLEILD